MNTQEMPAGLALNKLIAEQVMGYTLYHYDKDVEANCYFSLLDNELDPVVFRPRFRDGEHATEEEAWKDCPNFSGDIAAAFPLFAGKGWILQENKWNDANPWFIFPDEGAIHDWQPLACATTPELAICYARLNELKASHGAAPTPTKEESRPR